MTTNLSVRTGTLDPSAGSVPRILVIGGGIPAQVVTQTLVALGADVLFARVQDTPTHHYAARPEGTDEDLCARPSRELKLLTPRDVDRPPTIQRGREGFLAHFDDGTTSVHNCVVLAPGVQLKPKPASLPEGTELFASTMETATPERIAFLLDYLEPSDPALGMAAMKAATRNVRNGGESIVCFKHAPVRHLFGEKLYDQARNAGVQFVRFGNEPPTVQPGVPGTEDAKFTIIASDAIDREEEFRQNCDRVVAVTGPDPGSIPQWAQELAAKDLDTEGFVLADSVHCSSGNAFASGMFLVGEGTGNMDLIGCVAQAQSAAAQALAWVKRSGVKEESASISIGSECVRCLTCHRVCPHEAIPPLVDPLRARMSPVRELCRDCGICASACPSVAIRVPACLEETMTTFVSDVPRAEAQQTLFVFGCQRSAGIVAQTIEMPEHVRLLPVPCAGSVSENVIWSGLAAGARGILVVGCHHGNCASHTGTDWAAARVRRTLETGIFPADAPRVGYATIASNESARFSRLVATFLAKLPLI